jgi:uncharacterized protein YneF (UPF0154 family)
VEKRYKMALNKQCIHVISECIIISIIVFYFSRKMKSYVSELTSKIQEQELIIQKNTDDIKKIYKSMGLKQTESKKEDVIASIKKPITELCPAFIKRNVTFNPVNKIELLSDSESDSDSESEILEEEIVEELKELEEEIKENKNSINNREECIKPDS